MTPTSRDLVVAEVETLAGWMLELGLPPAEVERRFLLPVEDSLLTKHGDEAGRALFAGLLAVLATAGVAVPAARTVAAPHRFPDPTPSVEHCFRGPAARQP